jgi:hypothetical protein
VGETHWAGYRGGWLPEEAVVVVVGMLDGYRRQKRTMRGFTRVIVGSRVIRMGSRLWGPRHYFGSGPDSLVLCV